MIAKLGAVIFALLSLAFVAGALLWGDPGDAGGGAGGGNPNAIFEAQRTQDLMLAAAFSSFVCALFFGAMSELKRELEGIHTTLALQRASTSQSPPEAFPHALEARPNVEGGPRGLPEARAGTEPRGGPGSAAATTSPGATNDGPAQRRAVDRTNARAATSQPLPSIPLHTPTSPSATSAAVPAAAHTSEVGAVTSDGEIIRWFVTGRDSAGHAHTAYVDAPDRESAFAAAIGKGLTEVTSLEPREQRQPSPLAA